jgi:hypothetical protein
MTFRRRCCAGLAALAVLSLAVAVATAVIGPVTFPVGALRLRSSDPLRAGLLAAAFFSALVGMGWPLSWWRRSGIGGAILTALVLFAMTARGAMPQFPVADGAILELYTRHALHGRQLLGPYSQFGWFHPGPILFYWLAAFYAIGGSTMNSINAGALAVNLLALACIAWVGVRHGRGAPAFTAAAWCLIALFVYRVPALLTSAWNPHVPVVPLMALLFIAAGVAMGDAVLLPPLVVLSSLIVQSHIGFAPTAGLVGAAALAGFVFQAWRDDEVRGRAWRWALVAAVLLQVAWILPVAEQLTSPVGNMTRIVQYFFNDADTPQTWRTAWVVWSNMLTGVFSSGFALPVGHPLDVSPNGPLPLGGPMLLLGLVAAARLYGGRRRYEWTLTLICLGASLAGFWSVLHIRSLIGDYHVFWLSVIGLVDAALIVGAAAARLPVIVPARTAAMLAVALPVLVILAIGAGAVRHLDRERARVVMAPDNLVARDLATLVHARLPAIGHRPVFRLDSATWAPGAGVILQLDKDGDPIALDELAGLFGSRLAADGSEDVLILISGSTRHAEFVQDPRVQTLGRYGGGPGAIYADAVSLVDAPEYRRW